MTFMPILLKVIWTVFLTLIAVCVVGAGTVKYPRIQEGCRIALIATVVGGIITSVICIWNL